MEKSDKISLFIFIALITLMSSFFLDYIIFGNYTINNIKIDENSIIETSLYLLLSSVFYYSKRFNLIPRQEIIYHMNGLFIIFALAMFLNTVLLDNYINEDSLGGDFFIIGVIYLIINVRNKEMKIINLLYVLNWIVLLILFMIIIKSYNIKNIFKMGGVFYMYVIFYLLLMIEGYFLIKNLVIKKSTHYYNLIVFSLFLVCTVIKLLLNILDKEIDSFDIILLIIVLLSFPLRKNLTRHDK